MVTVSVLTIPNFSKEFVMEIDAFGFKLGVVLMQKRPVSYLSKTLSQRN